MAQSAFRPSIVSSHDMVRSAPRGHLALVAQNGARTGREWSPPAIRVDARAPSTGLTLAPHLRPSERGVADYDFWDQRHR